MLPLKGTHRHIALALLLLAPVLPGCGGGGESRWTLFPAPVIWRDPRLDLAHRVPPDNRDIDVRVFYATTRAPVREGEPGHYSRSPGDGARLGIADVRFGEPAWGFDDLVESHRLGPSDSLLPARVINVTKFGSRGPGTAAEDAFVQAIDRQLASSATGEAVIYVPGYRATFEQVMVLMGGWNHYLGRSSAVVAFSWPTGTNAWDYMRDCSRAQAFVPDIANLVELVATRTRARRVNLIGFSCGGPLLADALALLRARYPAEDHEALQRRYRIANAIFVAADVDLQTFTRSHLPALRDVSRRTEVYVSENDGALWFAALLSRASRIGRPRFDELTIEELETLASDERLVGIDVTSVPGPHELGGMRGHGYWVANPWISTDVLLSMIYPFDPRWRGLEHGPGRGLWTFPGDYPGRVGAAVYQVAPELRRAD
jgi:esterase/lipase superfamily enzyme